MQLIGLTLKLHSCPALELDTNVPNAMPFQSVSNGGTPMHAIRFTLEYCWHPLH